MNKTDISQEKIIEKSIEIVQSNGLKDLNMRNVAKACDVAVGSIYNYFPTKEELIVAVIAAVWRKVFHTPLHNILSKSNFTLFVSQLYDGVYAAQKDYHHFFRMHHKMLEAEDKNLGKTVMRQYMVEIQRQLRDALEADTNIKEEVWTQSFTKDKFIYFIFENMLSGLSKDQENCDFFIVLLEKLLYSEKQELTKINI